MNSYLLRLTLLFILLMSACEEKTYENPVDPDTELNPDDWAPTSLTIEILTDSDVKLSWQKSEIEATGFKIERQDTVGGAFVEVGSSDTTIYTDTGLLTGNEYLYQVCAYSRENKSSYALSDTIVTTFPAPYNISVVPLSETEIQLTWDDSTAYESGFVIERKNIVSDAFTVLDSTVQNTYQDTTVTLGNEYVYKVGAYSNYNNSSDTDVLVQYWQDCNGNWSGNALEDNCGICVGGNTGLEACTEDCNGNWGGNASVDCEGDCGGGIEFDCLGICGGSAPDTDGDGICDWNDADSYATVQIGTQLWMAENLKVTHYNDGSEIPNITDNGDWGSYEGQYGVYDNDISNADIYGNLYNWAVVDDGRGVCPDGWHVPSDEEFEEFEMYLDMSEEEATNESGFNGLPGGFRSGSNGSYTNMGNYGYFWSSSEIVGSHYAWFRSVGYSSSNVNRYSGSKKTGCSIRCLGD